MRLCPAGCSYTFISSLSSVCHERWLVRYHCLGSATRKFVYSIVLFLMRYFYMYYLILFRMVDNVYRTRSLGTAAEGLRDQYADGKAAKVWEVYIGDKGSRTENYRNFIINLLREKGCRSLLDVACGTG